MSKTAEQQIALVAGGTGLVGREILRLLAKDTAFAEVKTLVRRPLPKQEKFGQVRELVTDFGDLQRHPDWFTVDMVFSALGTTIGKAKSQEAFRQVDYNYPLAIAKLARAGGARHFLFVSALGANAQSPFFYNRVKGELEEAILSLGFPSVTIARPSLLLGDRQERRFGEELAKRFAWLLPSPWAGVKAIQVAAALVHSARKNWPGVRILENRELRRIHLS